MYVVLCLIVFGCQYQCNWLPGKTRLGMTYYVSSGTLNPTHSLMYGWFNELVLVLVLRLMTFSRYYRQQCHQLRWCQWPQSLRYWCRRCYQCHHTPLPARRRTYFSASEVLYDPQAYCTFCYITLHWNYLQWPYLTTTKPLFTAYKTAEHLRGGPKKTDCS